MHCTRREPRRPDHRPLVTVALVGTDAEADVVVDDADHLTAGTCFSSSSRTCRQISSELDSAGDFFKVPTLR